MYIASIVAARRALGRIPVSITYAATAGTVISPRNGTCTSSRLSTLFSARAITITCSPEMANTWMVPAAENVFLRAHDSPERCPRSMARLSEAISGDQSSPMEACSAIRVPSASYRAETDVPAGLVRRAFDGSRTQSV